MKKIRHMILLGAVLTIFTQSFSILLSASTVAAATPYGACSTTQLDYLYYGFSSGPYANRSFKPGSLCLSAPAGIYGVTFQSDGNLVVRKNGAAIWNSKTANKGATGLVLQSDGNVVIYKNKTPLWYTHTNGIKELQNGQGVFRIQDDSQLVIATRSDVIRWSSIYGLVI